MRNNKGFSLIELLIVVVIIGIIAAIAIPNLLASRRSANEAATISALRSVHGAQATYSTAHSLGEYAGTPGGLDGVALVQLRAAGLIDEVLGSGTKSGYVFTSGTTIRSATGPATFCTRAVPVNISPATATGGRCFGIATDGVIMSNAAANPANCGCSIGSGGEFVDRASALSN